MTDHIDIKATRARSDAATEGPWWVETTPAYRQPNVTAAQDRPGGKMRVAYVGTPGQRRYNNNDATFIANARTDIPAMADWIDEAAVWIRFNILCCRCDVALCDDCKDGGALLNRLKPAG